MCSSPRHIWLFLLFYLLIVVVAYIPALKAGFVWDDDGVLNNPLLKNARGLLNIWTKPHLIPQGHFWPLVYTTFWVEYQIWGTSPFGYHSSNVLLHGLCAFFFFLLLRRLKLPGAWLAAAVFALHPVHTESVAWIMERKNVLSGVFFFLSILFSVASPM